MALSHGVLGAGFWVWGFGRLVVSKHTYYKFTQKLLMLLFSVTNGVVCALAKYTVQYN